MIVLAICNVITLILLVHFINKSYKVVSNQKSECDSSAYLILNIEFNDGDKELIDRVDIISVDDVGLYVKTDNQQEYYFEWELMRRTDLKAEMEVNNNG